MQPNSEPSQADIAMVAEAMGQPPIVQAPIVQAAPEPQAPTVQAPETQAPQNDPFASLFATEPVASTDPAVQAPAVQPTEPMTPQPQQPVEPTQPVAPEPQAPVVQPLINDYQTFDEYMTETLQGVPVTPDMPDASKIDPDNPEAIKSFFDDLVNTAVTKSQAEIGRKQAITTRERQLWDSSFEKYNSLRTNKPLRDMVHDIRMGYFRRGQAITPTQAAEKLLDSMGHQYKQGVADSAVVTTIQDVQPNGGGTGAPVSTSLDKETVLTAVQTGGETALANYLDQEVRAGRI